MKIVKKVSIEEVDKQLQTLLKEATVDDLLTMYKLLCQHTARFVDADNGDFTVEYDIEVYR